MNVRVIADALICSWDGPRAAVASAPLGGGLATVRHVINVQVPKETHAPCMSDPAGHLRRRVRDLGLSGKVIGMMTAAPIVKYGRSHLSRAGICVDAVATIGLSNALAAGDPATAGKGTAPAGTINLIVSLSAAMTPACLVEAVMIATEAKVAALREIGVRSVVSGLPATGTGTDAICIVAGTGPRLPYCGKHLRVGELLGCVVRKAILLSYNKSRARG